MVEALAAVPLPDGRILLASGIGGKVRLWDPGTGQRVGPPLEGHTGAVQALAAVPLPDGRTLLASGGDDGTVALWDLVDSRIVARIAGCAATRALLGWTLCPRHRFPRRPDGPRPCAPPGGSAMTQNRYFITE